MRSKGDGFQVDEYVQVRNLITKKGWGATRSNENMFIQRAISLYSKLDTKQRESFLVLLEQFDFYQFTDYENFLVDIYIRMREEIVGLEKILIIPLEKQGEQSLKSGSLVAYLFRTTLIKYIDEHSFNNKSLRIKVKHRLTTEDVEEYAENPNSRIVFVDDFIGTGRSTIEVIKSYKKIGLKEENVLVLTFICLQTSIEKFNAYKFKFIYSAIGKTLSDVFSEKDDLEEKRILFKQISKKINSPKGYMSGYNESEALLATIRTPNNTLPFFWRDDKKKKIKSLFPR
ncbi:phosphoribosyltransferase [Listeria booriae]|uniref:phosphoribosyltransferase n=1 Tax=Listeria booriae TaxID=1552123 RepID=UPI001629F1DE|nr:phosphoribosyltransferase [Listeria booriae]MBC2035438.1 phosphoribosyltransferase [Listeria booriae]MBC2320537.1 phosphoribosyltransferase [Listeria booriae]